MSGSLVNGRVHNFVATVAPTGNRYTHSEERGVKGEELWFTPPATSGVAVTPSTALQLTAFYAAVSGIATDVASLPLRPLQRMPDGSRREAREHEIDRLLRISPDGETTSMRWRQALMGHALMYEGGYAEIVRKGNGRPASLHLLDPSTTRTKRDKDTRRLYYEIDGGKRLAPQNVLHVAGFGFDGLNGYNLINVAREALGLGLAAQTFGSSFFGNGTTLSGYIKYPGQLTSTSRSNLRDGWTDVHGGPYNAHRPGILEEGASWEQLGTDPEKAQALETRRFQVNEMGRIYRTPPHKIGDFSQAHLANIEASNLDYLMTCLMGWLEAIEQEFTFKLFTGGEQTAGYYVEHNMLALLRGDMTARGNYYKVMRDLGVFSPNDICQRENLDPLGPAGDVRLVPLNMTTLENAGKPQPGKATTPPPADKPETELEPSLDTEAPPTDEAPAARASGQWLDGNQMFSLKRLINDVASGELPPAAAKMIILASFPDLEEARVDAMLDPLNGFTPKSMIQ